MRCMICDVVLTEKEVKYNSDHRDFDPCTGCLDVINEVFEPLREEEINKLLEDEFPDVFEESYEMEVVE